MHVPNLSNHNQIIDNKSENFENTLVNRCQFAKRISDNRYENGTRRKNNGIPEWEIIMRDAQPLVINNETETGGIKSNIHDFILRYNSWIFFYENYVIYITKIFVYKLTLIQ